MQEIPLPNVKSPVLSKVIEFCSHHQNNPMREIEKVRSWVGVYTRGLRGPMYTHEASVG